MKQSTSKILGFVFFILLFIIIIWWRDINFKEKKYKNDIKIHYSGISGQIEDIYNNRGWSIIKFKKHVDDVIIGDFITESGERKSFLDVVQANDSLFSPSDSDSIYVIRNGQKTGYKLFLDFGKF